MPLENFGSILNFAEELEKQDREFFTAAAGNPACEPYREMFEQFATDAGKNIKTVLRTRRENVTEMILEPIRDFTRAPYCEECAAAGRVTLDEALATAQRLIDRAERYYTEAAVKIRALPEVARALKTLAKKHKKHREILLQDNDSASIG
jgi:rubrerythrin